MPSAFKPCALGIDSNDEFKREDVESRYSTTKNIVSSLPQSLWPPTLAGWWFTMRGSQRKSHMTLWSCGLARPPRDRLKTYLPYQSVHGHQIWWWLTLKGSPKTLFESLVTWSCKITWQTKTIIFLLPQYLWP